MHRSPNFFNSNNNKIKTKSKKMESKSHPSTPTQPKPKPKLDRRNASKNINYTPHAPHAPPHQQPFVPEGVQALPRAGFGSDLFSSELDLYSSHDDSSAIRTMSIDVYPWVDRRTSFRIDGKKGEWEIVCKRLGFSGPEDLGIPKADYDAMKVRSLSDNLSGIVLREGDVGVLDSYRGSNVILDVDRSRVDGVDVNDNGNVNETARVDVKLCDGVVEDGVVSDSYRGSNVILGVGRSRVDGVEVNDNASVDVKLGGGVVKDGVVSDRYYRGSNVILGIDRSRGDGVKLCEGVVEDGVLCRGVVKDVVVSDWCEDVGVKAVVSGGRSGGVGVRGERPPAVLLSPPPAPRMALPVFDAACLSWDILRSFGPEDNWVSRTEDEQTESSSEDERQRGVQGDALEGDGDVVRRGRTVGLRSGVLSDSCSFTSDDDSSSTTTDPTLISPDGRFKHQITSWKKGRHLGSGSFGSVYEGIADAGFFFAVKEVPLLDQGDKGRDIIFQLEREMAFLSQFKHKNIVRYLGTNKDELNLYIFLELVPQGSLLSVYQRVHLQDYHVSGYTRQILEGLKYLHGRNVIHRDIKCANILLDVEGVVKLADFGLAKEVAVLNDAKSCKGTSYWMAPEVVKPKKGYGRAADIWSLGCTVLEVLTQNFPYHPLDRYQAMFQIGNGEPPNVPDSLSRDARDFILKCLQVEPDTRPSAAELLEHPFVRRPHSSSPRHHGIRS